MRRTKIVCTLGPNSSSPDVIGKLIDAGLDVARLNFSHGDHDTHRANFQNVRAIAAQKQRNVAIMTDLQGPKIRTGKLACGGPVELRDGARFVITTRDVPGDAELVSTTYGHLPLDVKPGDRILLADGAMELRVDEVLGQETICRVVHGGMLGEHKGINLPGVDVSAPSLTEKDAADLELAVELGADYVALSFVRKPEDVAALRERIAGICRRQGGRACAPGIVVKIERPEALASFDKILPLTDVVMVARGDLGIEMDLDDVPQIQKALIRKCNERGTPVITATQMLESMMSSPRPTRAEVTDVANAIYDGTDAVMLSGETAVGKFPVESVRRMADIAAKADAAIGSISGFRGIKRRECGGGIRAASHTDAIGEAVFNMSEALDVARIVCFTQSGYTARAIARYRPKVPIGAITLSAETLRRSAVIWGVEALLSAEVLGIDQMVRAVDALLLDRNLAKSGETVIVVAGMPLVVGGVTNLLNLHTVGDAT
jgi:pyruvate kinase